MKKITAEIFKTKNKQFAFRFVHKNGNIISSTETYTRKANAKKSCTNFIKAITDGDWELNDLTVTKKAQTAQMKKGLNHFKKVFLNGK